MVVQSGGQGSSKWSAMEERLRAKLLANDELVVENADSTLLDGINMPNGDRTSVATSRGTFDPAVGAVWSF